MSMFVPQTPAGWAGWILALVVAVLAWVQNKRKTDVDESAIILTKWKEMVEAHERRVSILTSEVDGLRDRLVKAEARITDLEEIGRAKDRTIAGLEATIRQNSQSTAFQLKRATDRAGVSDERQDANDDRSLHIEDALARMDRAGGNSAGRVADDDGEN